MRFSVSRAKALTVRNVSRWAGLSHFVFVSANLGNLPLCGTILGDRMEELLNSEILGAPAWKFGASLFAILLAGFMRSFTGFGFALIAVPALALILPPQMIVPVVLALEVVTGAQLYRGAAPHADYGVLKRFSWPAIITLPLGLWLLRELSDDQMRLVLIGVLVATIALFALGALMTRGGRSPSPIAAYGAGGISGALCGATGIPGPPVIAYTMSSNWEPVRQRATMILYFIVIDVATLVAMVFTGLAGLETLYKAGALLPALLLGNFVGSAAFKRWGGDAYRPVAFGILIVIGIGLGIQVSL